MNLNNSENNRPNCRSKQQTYIYNGRTLTANEIEKEEKQFLKANYIVKLSKAYKCRLCETYRTHFEKIKEHVFSEGHQTICQSRITNQQVKREEFKKIPPSLPPTKTTPRPFQKISKAKKLYHPKPQIVEARYCSACDLYIYSPEEIVIHNMLHLHEEYNLDGMDIIQFYNLDGTFIRECIICQETFNNDKLLVNHLSTQKHKKRKKVCKVKKKHVSKHTFVNDEEPADIKKFDKFKNKYGLFAVYFCTLCSKFVPIAQLQEHCKEKEHQNYVRESDSLLFSDTFVEPITRLFMCFICNKLFNTQNDLFLHLKMDLPHRNSMKWVNTINSCSYLYFNANKVVRMDCTFCGKVGIQSGIEGMNHLTSKKHFDYMMKASSSLNNVTQNAIFQENSLIENRNINEENIKIQKKKNFKSGEDVNDCGLLNISEKERLILIQQKTMKSEGTKSNLFDNWKNNGKKYVELCIENGKENIYNVNAKLVSELILGSKLTYEEDSKRFCMICMKKFANNFELLYEHLLSAEHRKNLKNVQFEHKKYTNKLDSFSSLQLAHSYIVSESNGMSFKCYACNFNINNDNTKIKAHIYSQEHGFMMRKCEENSLKTVNYFSNLFKDMWYHTQNFYCHICDFKSKSDYNFVKHLLEFKHKEKKDVEFFFCPACALLGCGIEGSFDNHCNNILHNQCAKQSLLDLPDFSEIFTQTNNRIYDLKIESDRVCNDGNQKLLLDSIKETVQFSFPDATAYMFGSRLSNLGLQNSIVHVYLDCYGTYATFQSHANSKSLLFGTENYFEYDDQHWIIEDTLIKSKEPTLKLKHKSTKLSCHISFSSGLNVEKSILIGKFNEVYPKCREMILFLKKWLSGCNLSGSSLLTTYSVSWLVIFYLQTQNIFPSTYDLLKLGKKSHLVGGWDCGFVEKIPINKTKGSEYSTTELIKGFFLYYSVFDYKLKVICPFLGREVKKSHFANLEKLPQEMQIYASQMATEYFHFESPLCIQDPVHLTENITRALEKKDLLKLRKFCVEGLKCTY